MNTDSIPPIHQLIPHSGDMCLLACVTHWDADQIVCSATSHCSLDNPLRSDNTLPVHTGIEYAGQAIAAHGSLLAHSLSSPAAHAPRHGMIAILNGVHWHRARLDDITTPLTVHATRLTALPQGMEYRFCVHTPQHGSLIEGTLIVALQGTEA